MYVTICNKHITESSESGCIQPGTSIVPDSLVIAVIGKYVNKCFVLNVRLKTVFVPYKWVLYLTISSF